MTQESLKGKLQADGKLPYVHGNKREFLGMILLYCDGITQGTTLATIDQRLDEVVTRGAYREVDEAVKPFYDELESRLRKNK